MHTWTVICGLAVGLAGPTLALAQQGQVSCSILENGAAASGIILVRQGDVEIATASCGATLKLKPGKYVVQLALDGALDGPTQTRDLEVKAGAPSSVGADFATGQLEVRIESDGHRAAGVAVILKDGKQVGTLGSGVSAHLSIGTYSVEARYRTERKVFDAVSLTAGKPLVLEASFK